MAENYYTQKLNASTLALAYDTALPRVAGYLQAEIDFVRGEMRPTDRVLELGAGYGRDLKELAASAQSLAGLELAPESVDFGREYLKDNPQVRLVVGDAYHLVFQEKFDVVICLQNGLSAIKGRPQLLIQEALKVLEPGGRAYFSTYSPKFWSDRLAWFHEQADKGLLGAIDSAKTANGVIACVDGFRATTLSEEELAALGRASGRPYRIQEVDGSSLFLVIENR